MKYFVNHIFSHEALLKYQKKVKFHKGSDYGYQFFLRYFLLIPRYFKTIDFYDNIFKNYYNKR